MTELWILDNMDEGPFCPNCQHDLQMLILNLCFQLNKKRKWKPNLTGRCPKCKKFLTVKVEWIPETAEVSIVEL